MVHPSGQVTPPIPYPSMNPFNDHSDSKSDCASGDINIRLTHLIADDGPGGGPKTVLNHISYYGRIFDVELLHGNKGMLARACDDLGISHIQVPMEKLWLAPLGAVFVFFRLLARRPDLLILHGQWGAFWGAITGRLAGVRSILYIAQWPSFYTDWDLYRVARNYITEYVPCKLASAVVAISPGNHDEYLRRYPCLGSRLHMIPNSIDRLATLGEEEIHAIREAEGWQAGFCHVVCVGRLSTQKRVDWLLEAWSILESKNLPARLWVVGTGEKEQDLLAQAAQLGLKTCHFMGARPSAWKLVAASDIVAMPTIYEGHANIPLEAMACGVPIVACAVDGVRESFINGDAGLLVEPGDPEAFASAIETLIGSPELRSRMGNRGKDHIRHYDKRRILSLFYKLIHELTDAHTVK